MEDEENFEAQERVLRVLSELPSRVIINRLQIREFPDALEQLVNSLSLSKSSEIRGHAVVTLANIARDTEGQKRIGEVSGAISKILSFYVREEGDRTFQEELARAVRNLPSNLEVNLQQILDFPDALEHIVKFLSKDKSSAIREHAVFTLSNIAVSKEGDRRIGEVPGAVPKLVKLFVEDRVHGEVQEGVIRVLRNLSSNNEAHRQQIRNFPGAIEQTMNSLSADKCSDIREHAVHTVANIAVDTEGEKRLGEFSGAIQKLLTLFVQNEGNAEFREGLVRALRNLAWNVETNRQQILQFSGTLEALVGSLTSDRSSKIRQHAAYTLAHIATGAEGAKAIGEFGGAIPKLLTFFIQDEGLLEFQEGVVRVLRNLSADIEANRQQIIEFPGAIEYMVKSFSSGKSPEIREDVVYTLANIAFDTEGEKVIGEVSGAIPNLLTFVSQAGGDLEFQEGVLTTLRNLAWNEANRKQILDFPGGLEGW